MKSIQKLCGYLNFLTCAIFLGRAFLRRMYSKYSNCLRKGIDSKLKAHHHVRLDKEFKFNCQVWLEFLTMKESFIVNRPMIDLFGETNAIDLGFHSDASANSKLGFGTILKNKWIFFQVE